MILTMSRYMAAMRSRASEEGGGGEYLTFTPILFHLTPISLLFQCQLQIISSQAQSYPQVCSTQRCSSPEYSKTMQPVNHMTRLLHSLEYGWRSHVRVMLNTSAPSPIPWSQFIPPTSPLNALNPFCLHWHYHQTPPHPRVAWTSKDITGLLMSDIQLATSGPSNYRFGGEVRWEIITVIPPCHTSGNETFTWPAN